MFRTGGSAGTGITSGLAPRQGYQGTDDASDQRVKTLGDFEKTKLSDLYGGNMTVGQAQELSKKMSYKPRGGNIYDFLTEFGLNIGSMPPTGNIFQTAATAAKEPYGRFLKGKQDAAQMGYASEADMFKTLIESGAEAQGEGGAQWQKQWEAQQIPGLVNDIAELESRNNLSNEEKNELRSKRILLDKYSPEDEFTKFFLSQPKIGLGLFKKIKSDLYNADVRSSKPKYKPELGEDDPQLITDSFREFRRQVREMRATGGRVGYQEGMSVMPTAMPAQEETMPEELGGVSYEELRARLPQEVSDEIVTLLANSAEALEDFAVIQTEQDIANFNKKYGVNLVLPAGG